MTDTETVAELKDRIRRLKKRLREKMKYETMMLVNAGATPKYIEEIRQRDEAALSD